ncbi:hypothetical protein PHIM7_36 [Sinorhizobium phage phiM7]|uniref:Uncharacterized protein n=2 Tax=Emdodecavirus TaxID=1980937 RepID=S5MV06_9CAUD|nr:hypothetical protein AB690_gp042 [Sinorhizobium phage phiM12]YP_009601161.1 hypothetical protein FDH46_gp036 [Sinorhizobium phage phiM7]AGR47682.1 hypothetical protein SmphiM12_050 [Sinorhizobium phage phiM12]AKF12584.1 hypothetical protein PHIM7_36 [Sinorhizobium phage phiM7]AKF12944.1 hypothetical protein PHIM19_37 [Sinorhizobium phage phiM19]
MNESMKPEDMSEAKPEQSEGRALRKDKSPTEIYDMIIRIGDNVIPNYRRF